MVSDMTTMNSSNALGSGTQTNKCPTEYLAHEIRNPLSSAMLAHNFVKSSISDGLVVPSESDRSALSEDMTIVDSSLQFIDEFLQSMLLM